MTTPQVQNDPIYSLPFLYINGLNVSVASNTTLSITAGQCRDSNDIMDICLGATIPNLEGGTVTAPLTLNAATTGVNALDTGTFAASKVYAIYAIGDSRYYQPVATIMSLSLTGPLMPFGYDSYRLIGYAVTDSSVHFLPAYVSGSGSTRIFTYDAPQATAITAGSSATYAAVTLTAFVPAVDNTPVLVKTNWTANAANDSLNLQGGSSSGDQFTVLAPVAGATAHTINFSTVLSQLVTSVPTINYKVSAGTVAVIVAGFTFFI